MAGTLAWLALLHRRAAAIPLGMRPAVCLVLVGAACAGCSYDWETGAASGEAGVPEASAEAAIDAGGADAAIDVAVDAGVDVGPAPEGGPDAAYCGDLAAQVDTAKTSAKKCTTTPPDCGSSVKDQCGCTVFVAQSSSAATQNYVSLVQEFGQSGCVLGCGTCGPPPTQSYCLVNSQDVPVCTP
jgi:hypothetical protein